MLHPGSSRAAGVASSPSLLVVAALLLPAAALPLLAQEGLGTSLSGEVVEAGTLAPLAEALVRIIPETPLDGAEASGGSDGRGGSERATLTDALGRYRFESVAPGRYALAVERLGFRSARVAVEIRSRSPARVSVGLDLEPIALEPVHVVGSAPEPYDRDLSLDEAGVGGALSAELRQRRYLASDVWSLTHADVLGSVTLGETDLFRALQRLPGVSTRDDWTAELWTRGSAWDHTRVTFDGLPLFNPVHGAGVLSGVNSDAVGAVHLHPGVRPAALGEGVSALELVSRRGGEAGEMQGFGELSLASARLALDGPLAGGEGGWMLAARRTWIDLLTRGIEKAFDVRDAYAPYRFSDLTARVDHPLGEGGLLEVSGLWEADLLSGDIPDVVHGSRVSWGNLALRASLHAPLAGLAARWTLGWSGYHVEADTIGPSLHDGLSAPSVGEIEHEVRHLTLRGDLGPVEGGDAAWSAGWELVRRNARAVGETPPMYLDLRTTAERELARSGALTTLGAWYDGRWRAGPLELGVGLRAEGGGELARGGSVRLGPRGFLRLHAAPGLTLTAAAGRSHQYTQSLTPIGYFESALPSGHLWLLADETVPVLRADVATVGGEWWPGGSRRWLLSATGYLRASSGVTLPDPRPGITLGRPLFVVAEEEGRGVEVAVRRLEGRLTGSLAYTVSESEHALGELVFPTAADRREALDATALLRVSPAFRLGTALTWMTGSPYTRVLMLDPDPATGEPVGALGVPNAQRMPDYAGLDLMAEWSKRFEAWSLDVYLQVRNALGRDHNAAYTGTVEHCPSGGYAFPPEGTRCTPELTVPELRDEFLPGMPRIPLLGFRVRF